MSIARTLLIVVSVWTGMGLGLGVGWFAWRRNRAPVVSRYGSSADEREEDQHG